MLTVEKRWDRSLSSRGLGSGRSSSSRARLSSEAAVSAIVMNADKIHDSRKADEGGWS